MQEHADLSPLNNLLEKDSDIGPLCKFEHNFGLVLLVLGLPQLVATPEHADFSGEGELLLFGRAVDLVEESVFDFEEARLGHAKVFASLFHLILHEQDLLAVGDVGGKRLGGEAGTLVGLSSAYSE